MSNNKIRHTALRPGQLAGALLLFASSALMAGCSNNRPAKGDFSIIISLENPAEIDRKEVLVELDSAMTAQLISDLKTDEIAFYHDEERMPTQIERNDSGGIRSIYLLADLGAGEEIHPVVRRADEKDGSMQIEPRSRAELSHKAGGEWKDRKYTGGEFKNVNALRVPDEHTDHSEYIRYEGPGWESDKVGYRYYLDWRNAVDVFGKKTAEMVLQDVGQDGFESYHRDAGWGMDILKVGESLGIGSVAFWTGTTAQRVDKTDSIYCKIRESGPLRSEVITHYFGWKTPEKKIDLRSSLSIHAGSRMTAHEVNLSDDLSNLCTGIVKHADSELFQNENGSWGYLASWGRQDINGDQLGLAIVYRLADRLEITEDAHSHVVVLDPEERKLKYYFLAAWTKEDGGIHTQEAFRKYLDKTLIELGSPAVVRYSAKTN